MPPLPPPCPHKTHNKTYTSTFSHPYTTHSPLNTLDLHTPTSPPLTPTYSLLYIHGGAFRDPLQTSASLIPSLPAIFGSAETNHIGAVASVNYRLSPHPDFPAEDGEGEGRDVKWPVHVEDVRDAVKWLRGRDEGWGEWIVCGHSVGGTMALMLGMEAAPDGEEERKWPGGIWGTETPMPGLKAIISIAGIYDFAACRDAHPAARNIYDSFITGAFGPEAEGGWERGDLMRCGRRIREGVEVVLVVHSRGDELVEWGQGLGIVGVLEKAGWEGRDGGKGREGVGILVEVEGGHQEVIREGEVVGMVVRRAVGMLVDRVKGGGGEGGG